MHIISVYALHPCMHRFFSIQIHPDNIFSPSIFSIASYTSAALTHVATQYFKGRLNYNIRIKNTFNNIATLVKRSALCMAIELQYYS